MTVTEIIPSKNDIIRGYINRQQHLSFSSIKAFMQSPKHFIEYKTRKKEQTDAMRFGTAFHMAVLEPDRFEQCYAVAPKVDKRTKKGKAEWAAFCEANEGKEILKQEDYQTIKYMSGCVYENDASQWVLFNTGQTEVKETWEYSGFKWKGIIDGLGKNIIMDLKTISDADPNKCYRTMIYDMYYHVQAFLYKINYPDHDYYIMWVDKGGNVTVSKLRETTLQAAKEKLDITMKYFKKCLFLDQWDKSYDFYAPKEGAGIYSF